MISMKPFYLYMKANGLTQNMVAEKIGTTRVTVSTTKKGVFKTSIVDRICSAYHLKISDVIEYIPDDVYGERMKKEAEEKAAILCGKAPRPAPAANETPDGISEKKDIV